MTEPRASHPEAGACPETTAANTATPENAGSPAAELRATQTRTPKPRPIRPLIIGALSYLLAVGGLQWLIIWHPRLDEPRPVDAVVVLGLPKERLATGIELIEAGYSDVLVVSSPHPVNDAARVPSICRNEDSNYEVICFTPQPFTTEGEALTLAQLAAEHGWNEVIVVTYQSHSARARYYFERCASEVDTYFVANDRERSFLRWANRMLYETGGWLKIASGEEC